MNAAIVDALVTADWRKREAARLAGRHEVVVPVNLGDVTRLAYDSLRRQGYSKDRGHALIVPRLSPARSPLA